ncbi:MAG: 30S ribosomal protein S25e [Thermoprotei archaeon]|nr:MAG: 30S ribosomal protein S25e [Thermoprotei archaeon]
MSRRREKGESVELPPDVPRELFEKLRRDVGKGALRALTPYSLAQEYGIKISTAKKLLREAARHGLLELYSGGRRTPIYLARKK